MSKAGVPLSLFCRFKWTAYLFMFLLYPMVALAAAIYTARQGAYASVTEAFFVRLMAPDDWFSFWRQNCALASWHCLVDEDARAHYRSEDKWTFLKEAAEAGVPVSPFLEVPEIVVKHRNEEGGMGIHFFKNAVHGGDYIIQKRLTNNKFMRSMLPDNAPLSTFRIITSSRQALSPDTDCQIDTLSCVLRAGRAGAPTDHTSLLFDVDMSTGVIQRATTNDHWYQLGAVQAAKCTLLSDHDTTTHPDSNVEVSGLTVKQIEEMRQLCINAHKRLNSNVPLVGWDVALTEEAGVCLLEVCCRMVVPLDALMSFFLQCNLSCNFFRGSFDMEKYEEFMHDFFSHCESPPLLGA